ncbi:hypothetical protein JCM5350_000035 [Sporobolomyces pararoseus]
MVYLDNVKKLRRYTDLYKSWKEADSPRWKRDWQELRIDFSGLELTEYDYDSDWRNLFELLALCVRSDSKKRGGWLILSLNSTPSASLLGGHRSWGNVVGSLTRNFKNTSIRIPVIEHSHYDALWKVLGNGKSREEEQKECYVGRASEPAFTEAISAQAILDGYDVLEEAEAFAWAESEPQPCPIFTNFDVLVVPWLAFTAPIFLLETAPPERKPSSIPPTRLTHLELTFEVDASNPAQAIREVESFFAAIAPRIEILAFQSE